MEWVEFTREEYPVLLADSIGCSVNVYWAPHVKYVLDKLRDLNVTYRGIKVLQIKEKFGSLRIYTQIKSTGATVPEEVLAHIDSMIMQAEKNCANTCVECGSTDGVKVGFRATDSGWLLPLCDAHRCVSKFELEDNDSV